MNDNNYAEVPWYDGTVRFVPVGSDFLTIDGKVVSVRDRATYLVDGIVGYFKHGVYKGKYLITIHDEEPPIKIGLPTASGSLIKVTIAFKQIVETRSYYFMLQRDGIWRSEFSIPYTVEELETYIAGNRVEVIFDPSKS